MTGETGAKLWRASRYELHHEDDPASIKASPDAAWRRYAPFGSYRPGGTMRNLEAGPHLHFLKLKRLWEVEADIFHTALLKFATEYGLLGAFEEDYLPHPVFPEGKMLVAPEGLIDERGMLRRVDPSTEGKDLLQKALEPKGWTLAPKNAVLGTGYDVIALPSEIRLNKRNPGLNSEGWPVFPPRELVPWTDVQRDFGALLIIDNDAFKGVSVLCTREPIRRWTIGLRFFPSGDTPVEDLILGDDYGTSLNSYLQEVSPYAFLGEEGNLERGWRCRSLLQTMYTMLYLDLTGGNTVKKCQCRGCPNYFRVGSQVMGKYCSRKCANRASTRLGRGQDP